MADSDLPVGKATVRMRRAREEGMVLANAAVAEPERADELGLFAVVGRDRLTGGDSVTGLSRSSRVRPCAEVKRVDELAQDIAQAAEDAVAACEYLCGSPPDYSEASLAAVEEALGQAKDWDKEMPPEEFENVARAFGCYVLEVARRQFGGRYCWFEQRDAPVLVVGEPVFRVALLTWDHVRGRLSGDVACNIPFLYAGFAERARQAEPGTDALYV
jgi:hypothetical protein